MKGLYAVTAVLLYFTFYTCGYAQMRESVTVYDRIDRLPLRQVADELLSADDGFSYAMQDFEFMVFAKITHRVRALSDLSRSTISLWTRAAHGGVRLPFSRDEVEIECGERRFWCPIFKQYIGDILHKTRTGEGIYLHVWGLGAQDRTPVFYIVNFGTISEWGSRDDVLEDAIEGCTDRGDPEEALAIVTEMEHQWSGEDWWQEKRTSTAINVIKTIGHLTRGDHAAAETTLKNTREYIAQNPGDEFVQDILPALVRAEFSQGMEQQACADAMRIESADDDIEESFCESCLRRVLHAAELGKDLATIGETDTTFGNAVMDRGPAHMTYTWYGLQVRLNADPATGKVTEKRVTLRCANEDVLDWTESVVEDLLDELEEESEHLTEGDSSRQGWKRPELLRRVENGEEVLEAVFQ